MSEMGPTISDGIREAARFWEKRRIWYNAVLLAVVVIWVVWTWPHFRPAMTMFALGQMCVLGLMANLCYSGAYVAEFMVQLIVEGSRRRLVRQALWTFGTMLAILLENYWIVDEIYPDVARSGSGVGIGAMNGIRGGAMVASNMNFPAPLAVLGFIAAMGGTVVALAAAVIFLMARKRKFARLSLMAIGCGAAVYVALLLGFSMGSRTKVLAVGQEKYFCEIDYHLAYAVVDVKTQAESDGADYVVTLRTRFDETTTSPSRPKDAPLMPSPREVQLIDGAGRAYEAVASGGTSLMTPIRPGESYTTALSFRVPKDSGGLRLLVRTVPGWPDRVVIGDENSLMHGKTYFAL